MRIMPSRFLAVAIVIFWLATTAWFAARDLWPHWRSDAPPSFSIELADEAVRQVVPIRWRIERNGEAIGTIQTQLRFLESDDSYEFSASSAGLSLAEIQLPIVGRIHATARKYEDRLRVTRDGELKGMETEIALSVRIGEQAELVAQALLGAEVEGNEMQRRFHVSAPGLGEFQPALEPTEPIRGNVLNPLHPVHRLTGIRPGQRWRQPLVTPHEDIVRAALARMPGAESAAAALRDTGPRWLDASVRTSSQGLESDRGVVECLVIDYRGDWRGDEFTAQTWIAASDGAVLRQEADFQGQKLVLIRE
jgi:hypothetical protein